jgi:hypothetical protein
MLDVMRNVEILRIRRQWIVEQMLKIFYTHSARLVSSA